MSGPHIEDILLNALAQDGDKYRFGAGPDFNDPDPQNFDCSGLVRWACGRSGVKPSMPHSSFMQAQLCFKQGREIDVDEAVATRGALLFRFTDAQERPIMGVTSLKTRPPHAHVAWSLGDGSTIEAASTKWGVGTFSADPARRHWTHGGLIPGVEYAVRALDTSEPTEEDDEDMQRVMFFKGRAEGDVHTYVVTAGTAKHLSKAAFELHTYFKTPQIGSTEKPLGKEWQDGVAILDGPLQNVNVK